MKALRTATANRLAKTQEHQDFPYARMQDGKINIVFGELDDTSHLPNQAAFLLFEKGTSTTDDPKPLTRDGRHTPVVECTLYRIDGFSVYGGIVEGFGDYGGLFDVIPVSRYLFWRKFRNYLCVLLALYLMSAILSPWNDPNARHGHMPVKSDEEIQADIDTVVAWYQMEISVAPKATMEAGDTEVELRIENLEANHCDQKVTVYEEDDPDDVLFASKALGPGTYLETIQLAHPLEVGTHQLTVEFQGYDRELSLITSKGTPISHEPFGSPVAATVEVNVLPHEE